MARELVKCSLTKQERRILKMKTRNLAKEHFHIHQVTTELFWLVQRAWTKPKKLKKQKYY